MDLTGLACTHLLRDGFKPKDKRSRLRVLTAADEAMLQRIVVELRRRVAGIPVVGMPFPDY